MRWTTISEGARARIATEMSRLVLEMRDTSQNGLQNKRKLELLAERFLRIAEQDREGIDDITHSDRRFPAGVN
jgi:hypothetical protein